jgi:hypothetical protein
MDAACARDHAATVSRARMPATLAPDNELYDRGCDLVEAATAIRRVAGAPEATRAVPALADAERASAAARSLAGRALAAAGAV